MMPLRTLIGAVVSPLLLAAAVHASPPSNVRVVKPGGTNSPSGGMTWAGAWGSLSYAVAQLNASTAFNEIWVAHGTTGYAYTPDQDNTASDDDESVSIVIHKAVTIRGGFAGTEDLLGDRLDSNPRSKLSGNIDGPEQSYRLVLVDTTNVNSAVTFEKFEFEHADGRPAPGGSGYGGAAINADSASSTGYRGPLRLIGCKFSANHGVYEGGAVRAVSWIVIVDHCDFLENTVEPRRPNRPAYGGAICTTFSYLSVKNSTFELNSVDDAAPPSEGGAIACTFGDYVTCANCVFLQNTCIAVGETGGSGGAVSAYESFDLYPDPIEGPDDPQRPVFVNCLFADNSAGFGGGLYCPDGVTVTSCTAANNHADYTGGGLWVSTSTSSSASIVNSIFWDNTADYPVTSLENQFAPLDGSAHSSVFSVDYSCVKNLNSYFGLTTNIGSHTTSDNPRFRNPSSNNYQLGGLSPCVNIGDQDSRLGDVLDVNDDTDYTELHPWDLNKGTRWIGVELDMGAYESHCFGDFNGSGLVDGADLGVLLGSWGACAGCETDLNGDGVVDGADLGQFLGAWNSFCTYHSSMMMSGSGYGLPDLLEYLGAESAEEAGKILSHMSFAEMQELLQTFLGM